MNLIMSTRSTGPRIIPENLKALTPLNILNKRKNLGSFVHPKSEKGFTVHWKKFFTDLPPAGDYSGQHGLAMAYFDNPDELDGEVGQLRLVCWGI
jgi:hypothetical protein